MLYKDPMGTRLQVRGHSLSRAVTWCRGPPEKPSSIGEGRPWFARVWGSQCQEREVLLLTPASGLEIGLIPLLNVLLICLFKRVTEIKTENKTEIFHPWVYVLKVPNSQG